MGVKLVNYAVSTIANAGGIGVGDLSLDLAAGDGALFPSLTTGEFFYVTLISQAGVREIVKVTARVADALTIERAQEGTAAAVFAQNSVVELRLTAGVMDELRSKQFAKTANYTLTQSDLRGNYTFTNYGAVAEVNLTLPAGFNGARVKIMVASAQYLRATANGTDLFRMGANTGAAGGYVRSNVIGTVFEIEYIETLGQWFISPITVMLLADE